MAGASPEIVSFIELRRTLEAHPLARVWAQPVSVYADLAEDLADRSLFWESGWATDLSAFREQQGQAEIAGEALDLAAAQLESASPDLQLEQGWRAATLRQMEAVALIAGAWGEGLETLTRARALIPADLTAGAVDLVETVGDATEGRGPLVWGAVAGLGVIVLAVAVRAAVR